MNNSRANRLATSLTGLLLLGFTGRMAAQGIPLPPTVSPATPTPAGASVPVSPTPQYGTAPSFSPSIQPGGSGLPSLPSSGIDIGPAAPGVRNGENLPTLGPGASAIAPGSDSSGGGGGTSSSRPPGATGNDGLPTGVNLPAANGANNVIAPGGANGVPPGAPTPLPGSRPLGSVWPEDAFTDVTLYPNMSPGPASATDPWDQIWTLERALDRAMTNNVDLRVALAQIERQEGVRMQVRARLFPRLAFNGTLDRRERTLVDRGAFERTEPPDLRSPIAETYFDNRVEIRQLVFDGGSTINASRQQAFVKLRVVWTARDAAFKTAAYVRQSFDAVLYRQAVVKVREETAQFSRQLYTISGRRYQAGDLPSYEYLRSEAEVKATEADLAMARSELAKMQETFRRLLQLPEEASLKQPLRLEGPLLPRAFNLTLEDAVPMAKAKRADLQAAYAEVKAANLGIAAAIGSYFPTIEAYSNLQMKSSYYSSDQVMTGWAIGAAGNWVLFDGFEREGRLRTLQADKKISELHLDELQNGIISGLKEAYAVIDQTRKQIDSQVEAAMVGMQAVRQVTKAFAMGSSSVEDVLNARLALRRAQLGLLEATFNYNVAVAQIEYATGGQFEPSALSVPGAGGEAPEAVADAYVKKATIANGTAGLVVPAAPVPPIKAPVAVPDDAAPTTTRKAQPANSGNGAPVPASTSATPTASPAPAARSGSGSKR